MESVYNTRIQRAMEEDDIHYLSRLHAVASSLERMVGEPCDVAAYNKAAAGTVSCPQASTTLVGGQAKQKVL